MNKFAFIIHPLELSDVYRKFPFLKRVPDKFIKKFFRYLPPIKVSHIEGIKSKWSQIEGYFIACPLTTEQLLNLPTEITIKKIIACVNLAEKLGAQIVGLGAMTSVVGDAGITIAQNSNIPVTTGNSYTVVSAIEGALKGAEIMDMDVNKANVVILGANGSIGNVVAQLMAKHCNFLTLLSRNKVKLSKIARRIMHENGIAVRISNEPRKILPKADIIISVTSALETVINPEDLKPGAVVCDVARPRDVSFRVQKMRKDVLVIEGGIIKVPGSVNFNFDFGFPPGLAYACMAETMILALENKLESFSLGRDLSLEGVLQIKSLAQKHGFELAGLRSFEEPITAEYIENVKRNISSKEIMAV